MTYSHWFREKNTFVYYFQLLKKFENVSKHITIFKKLGGCFVRFVERSTACFTPGEYLRRFGAIQCSLTHIHFNLKKDPADYF